MREECVMNYEKINNSLFHIVPGDGVDGLRVALDASLGEVGRDVNRKNV